MDAEFQGAIRFEWNGMPYTIGWPWATLHINATRIQVEAPAIFLPRNTQFGFGIDDVELVERTRLGVRFVFKDGRPPIIFGTFWPKRVLAALAEAGVIVAPRMSPTGWTKV
ncbi:MAG: hypothetical protein ACYDAL_13235 [Candidatus Dormibacteraceae bacterium]